VERCTSFLVGFLQAAVQVLLRQQRPDFTLSIEPFSEGEPAVKKVHVVCRVVAPVSVKCRHLAVHSLINQPSQNGDSTQRSEGGIEEVVPIIVSC